MSKSWSTSFETFLKINFTYVFIMETITRHPAGIYRSSVVFDISPLCRSSSAHVFARFLYDVFTLGMLDAF